MTGDHYTLRCLGCGKQFAEAERGFLLGCDAAHPPALLRASYRNTRFTIRPEHPGIFRYSDWLPVRRCCRGPAVPSCSAARSSGAGSASRTWPWPSAATGPSAGPPWKPARSRSSRRCRSARAIPPGEERTLVVSSAGNTGRSFLQVASANEVPVTGRGARSTPCRRCGSPATGRPACASPCSRATSTTPTPSSSATRSRRCDGFYPEGGARNVARRDGMGTVVLAAAEQLGEVPRPLLPGDRQRHRRHRGVGDGGCGCAADGRGGSPRCGCTSRRTAPSPR